MAPRILFSFIGTMVLMLTIPQMVFAQESSDSNRQNKVNIHAYPVPRETPDMLFYLQRSLDMNSVIYETHYEEGTYGHRRIDTDKPVEIYWLINDPSGSTKPLSAVQKLGYGVRLEEVDGDMVQVHLVAYRDMPIKLKLSPKDDRYYAHISVQGKDVILKKVYINIDGGTKLKPNVTFIELTGTNVQNGNKVVHRFKP